MPPQSGAAPGSCTWPRWDGWEPVPLGRRDQGGALSRAWDFQARRTCQRRGGLRATHPTEAMAMRFDTTPHRFYGGVDRHARTLSLHILDQAGHTVPRPRYGSTAPTRRGVALDLGKGVSHGFRGVAAGTARDLYAATRQPLYQADVERCRRLGHAVPWLPAD